MRNFLTLLIYNIKYILTARRELLLIPLVSIAMIMVVVPYGLSKYTQLPEVGQVVASGLLITSLFTPSTVVAIYTAIEFSLGLLEKYLLLPVPRSQILLARFFAAAIVCQIHVTLALILAMLNGVPLSITSVASIYFIGVVLSLGITGVILTISSRMLDIQKTAMVASIATSILSTFSPLYFPLSALPIELQIAMLFNPVTTAVELIRIATLGYKSFNLEILITLCLLINLAMFTIGTYLLMKKLKRL